MPALRILCIHGVGHKELDNSYRDLWTDAITKALGIQDAAVRPRIDFVDYDKLFEKASLNLRDYAVAIAALLKSYVVHGVEHLFGGSRGFFDFPQELRWSAGMIAQWAAEPDLRGKARQAVLDALEDDDYDVCCAHSLGSLIAYDTFVRNPDKITGKVFATFGSQIGHPAIRDVFAGYIRMVPARHWFHLYNPNDHVFTCPLSISDPAFTQVREPFDIPDDFLNHNAEWYLARPETVHTLWQEVQGGNSPMVASTARAFARVVRPPNRRALLIGINDYPDPANRLEGCVNDVFLMSSLLQECEFQAEDIRVVLDARATAAGIMERLHWLLDGVADGDERLLFYSGHGAQMPVYGVEGTPDHVIETLVPWDFDWSLEKAITDQQFCSLYSQLPYGSHFVAMFDCCHSGGMTREGGAKVRGITPPDDVRHRAMRWDADEQMWVPRQFASPNASLGGSGDGRHYLGSNGATYRFGRGMSLRSLPRAAYNRTRKELGHDGPYLPVIIEACDIDQLSFEYRNGATSYGAFTWCLAQNLRESRRERAANLNYKALVQATGAKLKRLDYQQTPQLVGANCVLQEPIPWRRKAGAKKASKPAAPRKAGARKLS